MYLPSELWSLIHSHVSCMIIQRSYRRWLYRFVRRREWKSLREILMHTIGAVDFSLLMACSWVRREFLHEPESWIYMLRHSARDIVQIVDELSHKSVGERVVATNS